MKRIYWILIVAAIVFSSTYFLMGETIVKFLNCKDLDFSEKLQKEDPRNNGLLISVCYKSISDRSTIIIDLLAVGKENSQADVFRYLLQLAEKLSDKNFIRIEFAHNGISKFYLDGGYFNNLGKEYKTQNPIYTMRTLPENLKMMDGSQAYQKWTGGVIGVLGVQMKDFTDFQEKWYLTDLVSIH